MSDSVPPGEIHGEQIYNNIAIAGRPRATSGTGGMVTWRSVTPEYFSALDIPILRGSGFIEQERMSNDGASSSAACLHPACSASRIPSANMCSQFQRPWYTVVGVAANVKNAVLAALTSPSSTNSGAASRGLESIHRDGLENQSLPVAAARGCARRLPHRSNIPVDIETLTQTVNSLADRRDLKRRCLALRSLWSVDGGHRTLWRDCIHGSTAHPGDRRAHGFGRNTIGYSSLIAGEGVRLIVLGGVVGLGAALAAAQLLKSLLFHVGAHDPVSFIALRCCLPSLRWQRRSFQRAQR